MEHLGKTLILVLLATSITACSDHKENVSPPINHSSEQANASQSSVAQSSSSAPAVACVAQLSTQNPSEESQQVFSDLRAKTCGTSDGIYSGQNAGHGDQINDDDNVMGYAQAVGLLEQRDGVTPVVLGLDYEHDEIFNADALNAANATLIQHAEKGGLITINWAPLSPWVNDGQDPDNNPGSWLDTRSSHNFPPGNAVHIDLEELIDPSSLIYSAWRARLDQVAAALATLQQANVPVLFRPLQEMDGLHFWWGAHSPQEDAQPYINVWRDMHNYFTQEKGLDNLIWVYSPSAGGFRDALWAYPGDDVVDVIAATHYSKSLDIPSYAHISGKALSANKVFAMAEFGPALWGDDYEPAALTDPFTFDANTYARLLKDFPATAYWVSWHSYPNGDGFYTRLSLSHSANTDELFATEGIISLDHKAQ